MKEGFYASVAAQRTMIWFTIVFAVIFGIALFWLTGFFPPPRASLSAEQVQLLYSEHNIRFRIGTMLGSFAGAFIVPLTVVIFAQMARLEKGMPLWSILQLVAGSVGSLFIFLPFMIWAAAAFTPERPAELTLLLHEFGWLVFITGLSLFPMQLIGIIVIAFTKDEDDRVSAFPRWIGYLTAWELVQSLGGPIAMLFKDGIFAWQGLIPFWLPFVLFGVWISALLFTLMRALRHQAGAAA